MRHHRKEATQFELFCLSDQANRVTMPAWQNLPAQTRQEITCLMTRLLVEHGRGKATERVPEDFDPTQIGEEDDV